MDPSQSESAPPGGASSGGARELTPAEVERIADRVYRLLLDEARLDRSRRGGAALRRG
jgi:hypothetical protein